MATLYSYCVPFDDGAAPNPFWGICTLNICKPAIRRTAKIGDWVVGTGSMQFGFENKVVYAMEVTDKMTMEEYYHHCKGQMQEKIPNINSGVFEERVGDCIYDFSHDPPIIIPGVHDEGNRKRDLGGKNCLLSTHFYYFGDKPESLPSHLLPIVKQGRSHKSIFNQPYLEEFITWITQHEKARNKIYSQPQARHHIMNDKDCFSKCAARDKELDDEDERIGCE
jgi:hypothetical protein